MLFRLSPFSRLKTKSVMVTFYKCFTNYERSTCALRKRYATRQEVAIQVSLPFPDGKLVAWKMENIKYLLQYAIDFFILSLCVWENNGLLNKKILAWLYIIDQGHRKSNVSQFFLYPGFYWNNLTRFLPQWWPFGQQQKYLILWPWKCRSRSPFTKIIVSQLLYERFFPNVYRMMTMLPATKISNQLTLKM